MIIIILLFILLQGSALSDDENYSVAPNGDPAYFVPGTHFILLTRVFNAYPNTNVSAFVLFEEERVSRLRYGQLAVLNVTFELHLDFLIQFRQIPTEGHLY